MSGALLRREGGPDDLGGDGEGTTWASEASREGAGEPLRDSPPPASSGRPQKDGRGGRGDYATESNSQPLPLKRLDGRVERSPLRAGPPPTCLLAAGAAFGAELSRESLPGCSAAEPTGGCTQPGDPGVGLSLEELPLFLRAVEVGPWGQNRGRGGEGRLLAEGGRLGCWHQMPTGSFSCCDWPLPADAASEFWNIPLTGGLAPQRTWAFSLEGRIEIQAILV